MIDPVIISGGGIIGCYIHLKLRQAGIKSLVIEKNKQLFKPESNIRTISLNQNTISLLSDLGIKINTAPIKKIDVADGEGSGKIEFSYEDTEHEALSNVVMFNDLLIKMQETTQSAINFESEIKSLKIDNNLIKVVLEDNRVLSSSLVIGSDGRNSPIAKLSNFVSRYDDYEQTAYTFLVEEESFKELETAHQIFTNKGIFALMPIQAEENNIFSVVWSVPNKLVKNIPAKDFVKENIGFMENKLNANFNIKSDIVSFPLSSHHLESYTKAGIVVVGDAAHSLHPLAGQGINLGFADAEILCEELISAHQKGYSISSYRVLKKYEMRRKTMNEIMIKAMDGFVSLFGSSNLYLRLLRNFGLNLFNKSTFIKVFFIRHASGNHKL
jgi:2-octaprenylphenol hydroxylase